MLDVKSISVISCFNSNKSRFKRQGGRVRNALNGLPKPESTTINSGALVQVHTLSERLLHLCTSENFRKLTFASAN